MGKEEKYKKIKKGTAFIVILSLLLAISLCVISGRQFNKIKNSPEFLEKLIVMIFFMIPISTAFYFGAFQTTKSKIISWKIGRNIEEIEKFIIMIIKRIWKFQNRIITKTSKPRRRKKFIA